MKKSDMKNQAIAIIKSAIYATEHTEPTNRHFGQYYYAQVQGKIWMAYSLGIITKKECDKYLDLNTEINYRNPTYFK